jgi:energy-coupling factor transporter ATP-binding protein EcfA2
MENPSLDAQREQIEQLARLIAEREQSEVSLRNSFEARDSTTRRKFKSDRERLNAQIKAERESLHIQHTEALSQAANDYEQGIEQATLDHEQSFRDIKQQTEAELKTAEKDCKRAAKEAEVEFNDGVNKARETLYSFKDKLEQHREELHTQDSAAMRIVRRRRCKKHSSQLDETKGSTDSSNPLDRFATERAAARGCLDALSRQLAPRILRWWVSLLIGGVAMTIGVVVGVVVNPDKIADFTFINLPGWAMNPAHTGPLWLVGSGGIAIGLLAILYVIVRPIVVRQTVEMTRRFHQHVANADTSLEAARAVATAEADNQRITLKGEFDEHVARLHAERNTLVKNLNDQRETRLTDAADALQEHQHKVAGKRDQAQDKTNQLFEQRRQRMQKIGEEQVRHLNETEEAEISAGQEAFQRSWQRTVQAWQDGVAEFEAALDGMTKFCQSRFPDWETTDWEGWNSPDAELPALAFGSYSIGLEMFENGVSKNKDLATKRTTFELPAIMSFTDHSTMLYETWGEGRSLANNAMQNVMLRLLTSLPPGKVRFTIIDPVGLGQDFSAFMHLADFDERLVTHRIWTETEHINKRLTDLTEHMEDVIQTYLRNEFRSIDEYNRHAGEVAEPFHILVASNFPAGFSDEAAARMLSIVNSGARCGVYTVLSVDTKQEMPRNFNLADLEQNAVTVQWNGKRFCWLDEDIKDLPLELAGPPTDECLTKIIKVFGKRAKEANRVEVPFSTVAAARDKWWTFDSRDNVEVALGRAGATKLQTMKLGKGTSQHVLISGKTGSGKSTLLHALITNTAIHYSPEEVQFYLIDFKKGVEFKTYATLKLPHARVVAIESEREFGMSVLQRLDDELKVRGDLFRDHGVQDIKNYRNANPDAVMPRLLLVIDEFQEFFVSDDKVAQDAALLLDRLVRQGRAFGIHVLLGSQTLAGAYSLARSTIGQMAVRVALQCSEADSHLILSEDNTAARLLSRPGDAIYNDANGLFEGNHPFQVVWLAAKEQDEYLAPLAQMAIDRGIQIEPMIVFEGNAPADPAENQSLRRALEAEQPATPLAPTAWLGSAVAIKDPTSIVLRRQSGSNLLVVGQQEEPACGILASCLLSLAAEVGGHAAASWKPRFYVFDGTRPEAPDVDFWQRLSAELPIETNVVKPKDAGKIISELADEVSRRAEAGDDGLAPVFIVIYDLSRFRDLRRSEDDFSFSMDDDKPVSADKHLATVLRDGPAFGVHTLIWCDTYNSVSRAFDRQTLRELDNRILFQMSATDSANLMDSPIASRLGEHRAILYSEEQGQFEKFRPYGPPANEWVHWIKQRLDERTSQAPLGGSAATK